MFSAANVRDGDLWTEAVRALGIRTSGKLSPLRELETRDDALAMVRDCSVALILVGLVQVALATLAGVGSAVDAAVYMPLAVALYRYTSRLAALLLLGFALFAVAATVLGSMWAVDSRTDLVLIATLLWAGARSVEATSWIAGNPAAAVAGRPRDGQRAPSRSSTSSRVMSLAITAIGFGAVLIAKFLVPLAMQPSVVARPAAPVSVAPVVAKPVSAAAPVDDGRMRFSPPAGFVEPRAEEPEIASIAAGFVPPTMELEALFVTTADLESFRREHKFSPAPYVMVQTARTPVDERVSSEDFRAATSGKPAADVRKLERLTGGDATLSQWIEAVMHPSGAVADLGGAQVRSEGVVDAGDRSLSVASVVEVPATKSAPATRRVAVTSFVLARGHVLVVQTYGSYSKAEDVAAATAIARDVTRRLIDENPA